MNRFHSEVGGPFNLHIYDISFLIKISSCLETSPKARRVHRHDVLCRYQRPTVQSFTPDACLLRPEHEAQPKRFGAGVLSELTFHIPTFRSEMISQNDRTPENFVGEMNVTT